MNSRRRPSRDADLKPVSLRRPSRRAMVTSVVALLLAAASLFDHSCNARDSARHVEPSLVDKKSGTVTHVVDGDTIDVAIEPGKPSVRVRLLGIDAPECEGDSQALGFAAKDYMQARCGGKLVTLRLDELQRDHDKYGRLLAYVYLANSELLNESLVRDGMAFSHRTLRCDLSAQLDAAENEARKAKRGLWKTITVAEMPEWRQRWMSERGLK